MIESIVVIAVGIFLLWLSMASRKANKQVDSISTKEKADLLDDIDRNPKQHYLVGGSVTKVPRWVVFAVLMVFVFAIYFGVISVT
ncbi:hypothetical protein H4J57_17190 [Colwellia sp. BRX8-7]|uniref:hypothetical protein n=1 Tax=Colwellia sp. BRX8-7 TaxID=2759833 RepID=UPI0015F37A55|nr:hypothetical protein [Colwellia sp. BRX8-7]MBA6338925.1 hypothetical protein [Colwellia sp. BRX8-7]